MMTISLTPELEELVRERMQSGGYQTALEVVDFALRQMQEHNVTSDWELQEVMKGAADIDAGRYSEYAMDDLDKLRDEIKQRGRARLKAHSSQ